MLVVTRHATLVLPFVAAVLVFLAGCFGDAERGNPLDPLSGNFDDAGAVAGTVTSFFAPFEGIEGVRVSLSSQIGGEERVGVTGASGRFSITHVPAGTYEILTELSGYEPVSDTVTVELGQLVELSMPINGIPTVQISSIHTEHLNRWFPQDPLFQLVVEVTVNDPDGLGDVNEVRLTAPSLDYSDTLRVVVGEPGVYSRIFAENELPVPAQELLGLQLGVEVTDNQGVQGSTDTAQIVRIVETFPDDDVRPREGEIVGSNPTLVWRLTELPYSFSHRVDISFVPVPGQEIHVARYSGLTPTDTTFTIPDALQAGSYLWTVSAVDAFSNLSRSRPQGFNVTPVPLRP